MLATMLRTFLALVLMLPVLAGAAAAVNDVETRLVTAVVDGDTLVVDSPVAGTRQIRLAAVEAPRLPLGRPGFPTWPLAHAAREVLETLALGRRVRITYGADALDRHGRLHAQVHRDDGAWLQAEMLRRGFARVRSVPVDRAHVDDLLAVEAAARAAQLGIWSHPFYAVRTPAAVAHDVDSFQIVEGRVTEAVRVGRRIYLNFGDDWRSDFTVSFSTRLLPRFEAAGLAPLSLAGQVIRVRGWIISYNGPMIDVDHPEQIEVATP